ncbi:ferritin-like domain-containing protein [Actinoallomurus vinaceus]|uniref:ferritin-like domain-containing protein n=1 Tax=Actinoallomurus vinaceus TaxID=1080074 RepID=UPI0031EEC84F
MHAEAVAQEFQEHAAEEQSHADMLAERIAQLGGEPAPALSPFAHKPAPRSPSSCRNAHRGPNLCAYGSAPIIRLAYPAR